MLHLGCGLNQKKVEKWGKVGISCLSYPWERGLGHSCIGTGLVPGSQTTESKLQRKGIGWKEGPARTGLSPAL